ncbi:YaaW family protein [Novispirillum itersonii]|uniref:Uncharacterized protein YaaW (UPF0174 family) n=1 Tax=Novispirillum itersonii TaxID=189 RepID=A0A7X0DLP2_NOVIT|nr:ubiquinol-cytochrome C chaperone family protein [Novispirillum itersonii]MBB6210195.1 uncharacterized protein YaaW (UPF0174 family) [Novispirillum itersonii]
MGGALCPHYRNKHSHWPDFKALFTTSHRKAIDLPVQLMIFTEKIFPLMILIFGENFIKRETTYPNEKKMKQSDLSAIAEGRLLPLLSNCSDDDLDPLVSYILSSISEEISNTEEYKSYSPQHSKYVYNIVKEIRLMGGNSFANIFRGNGPPYDEIVRDVCEHIGIKEIPKNSAEAEQKILVKIFEEAWEKMPTADRETFLQEMKAAGQTGRDFSAVMPITAIMAQVGVQMSGFLMYRMATVVANAVAKQLLGKGLTFAANAALTRTIGVLAGPIGWIITGLWTAIDLAGPAYRVTVPCVIHIAYLRQKILYSAIAETETTP